MWDKAFADFKSLVNTLAELGRKAGRVVAIGVEAVERGVEVAISYTQAARRILETFGKNLTYEWKNVEQEPNATVESDGEYSASVEIEIPLPNGTELVLTPKVTYQRTVYSDSTMDITITEEMKASLQAELEAQLGPENKAAISAALSLAVGRERTFRISTDKFNGQPADLAFLQQDLTRTALQVVATTGGVNGLAASGALKLMAPTPEPIADGYYVKLGAEVGAEMSVGGTGGAGVDAKVEGELELKYTSDKEHNTARVELSAKLTAAVGVDANSESNEVEGSRSASIALNIDEHGTVAAIEFANKTTLDAAHGAAVGGIPETGLGFEGEIKVGHKETTTETTTIELSPEQRQRVSDLVKQAAGVPPDPVAASNLAAELVVISATGDGATTTTYGSYDYVKEQAEIGGGPVKVTLAGEQRFNQVGD